MISAFWLVTFVALAVPKAPEAPGDPKLLSAYPFTGERGGTLVATIRGSGLQGATAVVVDKAPLAATIEGVETEVSDKPTKVAFDLVRVRISIDPTAKPGRYPLRLVTPRGVSNALTVYVVEQPITAEPAGSHETPDTAAPVEKLPAVINGRIARRGESDYYVFDAKAGQTLTFEAISGLPSTGAPGGNAVGFDPSLSLYEPSGSWFDAKRVNRIAFNDEPLWIIGQLTDAYLVHKFEKSGRYLLRIEAFSGQGGPDYSYQLKIRIGEVPQDLAPAAKTWKERNFPRRLSANRLNEVAERGGKPQDQKAIETYRGTPVFKLPGTLEGDLSQPGEIHRSQFHLDGPQDLAIEIETPELAPPLFNPVVRLLDGAGREVATNIFAGRGGCTNEMTKAIQAKTTVALRDAGDYTVEIRDTTSDLADPGFRYRVQIRPQIAHVGEVRIEGDHINLVPGGAQTVRVIFDREEGYTGAVAVTAEALPEGVQALPGADFEPEKDPPRYSSRRERYTARTERVVVAFTASPDAAIMKGPRFARIVVRPITDGKPGAVLGTKQIPLMVVAKP